MNISCTDPYSLSTLAPREREIFDFVPMRSGGLEIFMEVGYLKSALKLILVRLAFVFIAVFFLVAFTWLIALNNGALYYSVLVCIFYLSWIFNDAYAHGGRDMRGKRVKTLAKGFLYGLLSEAVSVVLFFAVLIFNIPAFVYIIWQAPFAGFICPDGGFLIAQINPLWLAVILFVPLFCGIGYICGVKKIEVSYKNIGKRFSKNNKTE